MQTSRCRKGRQWRNVTALVRLLQSALLILSYVGLFHLGSDAVVHASPATVAGTLPVRPTGKYALRLTDPTGKNKSIAMTIALAPSCNGHGCQRFTVTSTDWKGKIFHVYPGGWWTSKEKFQSDCVSDKNKNKVL